MLSRLTDNAIQFALKLDETMAACIPSIAGRELSEGIELLEADCRPKDRKVVGGQPKS